MAKVVTGAKAKIVISTDDAGEIPIAFASGINITHENRLEEIPQLDSLELVELAENGHRCSFSVNFFKLLEVNSITYAFDSTSLDTLLIQPELKFQILDDSAGDGDPNRILYEMRGVKFEGGTGSISARGIWEGQWNFRARRGVGI